MRRGEIWLLTVPGMDQLRPVLVISNDHANADHRYRPATLDIHTPHVSDDYGLYLVQLAERDPMPQHLVDATTITSYTQTRFGGKSLGIVTEATLVAIDTTLKSWLDIH